MPQVKNWGNMNYQVDSVTFMNVETTGDPVLL